MTAPGSMTGVLRALAALPRKGRGRAVMIVAARRGEGASTIARTIAEGASSGVTLLLDLDLIRSEHRLAYAQAGPPLSEGIDARLKGQRLYRIVDAEGRLRPDTRGGMAYFRVGRSKLFVSGFDAGAALQEGDRLQVLTGPSYWTAVRQSCELCVVDAPALEDSRVGLSVAAHMDGVVLVACGATGSVTASVGLKTELEAVGAFVMGVVYTRADSGALTLERLLG